MDLWDPSQINPEPHHPVVLHSEDGVARIVAINLPAGEELQEHEVHERAWLLVAAGEIELNGNGESSSGGPGFLAHFAPKERHQVLAKSDARLILLLSPWPGEGHPSRR
jgi:quercetin dioxygenase-like cupin family protein